ncbi:Hypothetical predicted protein [Paramuricea clavata]|uniref:Uncharacterized protein n=1 Tax=Paramuricea clavata TaxID=317549 RepID=A0A7D9JRL9_PARCT|nr:Hypothetical predicted protein [Paramuricea clavata]
MHHPGNIPLQHVVVVDQEKGDFTVRSQQDSAKCYRVTFGTDTDPVLIQEYCQSFDHNTDVLDDLTSTSQPLTVFNDLPQKKTNHRTEAARSREILGQIKNLTYVAEGWQDGKLLEKLNRKLETSYQFLKDYAPKENGITLEVPPPKRLAVKTTTPVNQHPIKSTTYKQLPTAPKKKPYSG